MDAGGDRVLHSSNVAVIREVYEGEFSQQRFSIELEKALETCCAVIVIEPTQLGDETARWIRVGNCLHKTAVISGTTSLLCGLLWPDSVALQCPLTLLSGMCTSMYTLVWQFDHCVKYQVEKDARKLARLPVLGALTTSSPVVLVRTANNRRILLHWTVTLSALALCAYRISRSFK